LIKEAIKNILLSNGTVEWGYKRGIGSWYDKVIIYCSIVHPKSPWTVVHPDEGHDKFENIDEAIDLFCKYVFTVKNIALAFRGIVKHKLADEITDLADSLPRAELRELVKKYNAEYFPIDYPEFVT
jgi:hypothetical protein